jgi:hypothetical protein
VFTYLIQLSVLLTSPPPSSSSSPPFAVSEFGSHIYPETSNPHFCNLSQITKTLIDLPYIFYRVYWFSGSALGFYLGRGGTCFKSLPRVRLLKWSFLVSSAECQVWYPEIHRGSFSFLTSHAHYPRSSSHFIWPYSAPVVKITLLNNLRINRRKPHER